MFFIAIATAFTLVLWWILDLIRTDEKAIRIKFGQLGRKGRRLGLYEEFLWTAQTKVGLGVNVNALLIESSEDIAEAHVRQALNSLWRRHPLLRCSIITISKGKVTMNYFTEIAGKPGYDLQMVPSIDWKEIFEDDLNIRFLSSGPQWRVKVALPRRENDKYVYPFIFSFNSCVVDGASITDGVFKDFQKFLTKAVYPDSAMSESVMDPSLTTSDTVSSDVMGTSFSEMSSSIMSTSGGSIMSSSTCDNMNISADVSDASASADDISTCIRDITKPKSDDVKVLRLLPAQEYIYKELKPRWYERPLLLIVNKFHHKPFLSVDPTSLRIQAHLKPRFPIRKTGVLTFLLNEKETEIFIQECCTKRISVTSAVLAAAAVSLQDLLRSKAFHGNLPLKLNTLLVCNMRQASKLDVPQNTLGNHEGMLNVTISLPKSQGLTQNIWKPAKSLHKQFHSKLHSARAFSWSRWLNHSLGSKNGVETFLAAASKTPKIKSYAFCIRERGEVKHEETEDKVAEKCRVKASYFVSAEHMVGLAMFSLGVVTIQGQLYITIGYDRQVVDYVIAEEFSELLKENLTRPDTEPVRKISSPSRKFRKFGFQALQYWYPTSA
jgi:hypothetical protein